MRDAESLLFSCAPRPHRCDREGRRDPHTHERRRHAKARPHRIRPIIIRRPEHARAGPRCFRAKLRKHGVEHRASHFISVLNIVQRKSQNVVGPLNHHSVQGVGTRDLDWFGGHGYTVYKGRRACQPAVRTVRRPFSDGPLFSGVDIIRFKSQALPFAEFPRSQQRHLSLRRNEPGQRGLRMRKNYMVYYR